MFRKRGWEVEQRFQFCNSTYISKVCHLDARFNAFFRNQLKRCNMGVRKNEVANLNANFVPLSTSISLLLLKMVRTSADMPPKSFDRKMNNPLGVMPGSQGVRDRVEEISSQHKQLLTKHSTQLCSAMIRRVEDPGNQNVIFALDREGGQIPDGQRARKVLPECFRYHWLNLGC